MVGVALRHRNVSIELRDRRYRTVPFLVSIAANVGAVMYFNMWRSDSQGLILVLMVVYLLNNVVLMAINFKFKISLHMASIAGTASILLFMVAGVRPIPIIESTWLVLVAMTFILLVPVLWWARRKLDAHTSRELIAGALFGLIIPFIELYLLSPAFA